MGSVRVGLAYMKLGLNVVGPQVRKFRNKRSWTQTVLAQKLQLHGWDISVGSLGKLEAQLRRVPDCELMFLSRVLGVEVKDLFPKNPSLKQIGPAFQSNKRLAIFPARGER
jgi:transcriptional regulator with XRE-family HTH domain